MTKYLDQQKTIKQIRDTMDGYLSVEKELQEAMDSGMDDYAYDDRTKTKSFLLGRELDSQYTHLEGQLKSFGFTGHPVQLIEIYSESKMKAIHILDGGY